MAFFAEPLRNPQLTSNQFQPGDVVEMKKDQHNILVTPPLPPCVMQSLSSVARTLLTTRDNLMGARYA